MPRNGSGTFSGPSNSWNPAVGATSISSTDFNTLLADIETALSASIAVDGQTVITADLPMAGNKHTGVGNAAARNQYLAAGQAQDGAVLWGGTGGGTADVITITLTPTLSAYTAGQGFRFISSGANTTNVTLNVDSIGAAAVNKVGGTALIAGDIPSGAIVEVVHDGTDFELTNIQPDISAFMQTVLDDANAAAAQTTLGVLPGTDVQAWDTQLDDIAALAVTDGNFIVGDGANWVAESGATARASLGVSNITAGTMLTKNPMAAGSTTTTAHTLGAEPTFNKVIMECIIADNSWDVGDRLDVNTLVTNAQGAATDRTMVVAVDATNIRLIIGDTGTFYIPEEDNTTSIPITLANWKVEVTPYLVA